MAEKSGFSRADSAYLLSGDANASAYGTTEWTESNGAWRATWPVSAKNFEDGSLLLLMRINPRRVSEPTVVLIVRGDDMRRVDVNGGHRGQRFTHIQGANTSGGEVFTEAVGADFVEVEHSPALVSGETYRRVLQDSAKLFSVDVSAVDWTDPPEGATQ